MLTKRCCMPSIHLKSESVWQAFHPQAGRIIDKVAESIITSFCGLRYTVLAKKRHRNRNRCPPLQTRMEEVKRAKRKLRKIHARATIMSFWKQFMDLSSCPLTGGVGLGNLSRIISATVECMVCHLSPRKVETYLMWF